MSSFYAFVILCFFNKVSFSFSWTNNQTYCPQVETASTFDVDRFLGRWYPIVTTPKQTSSIGRCLTTDISSISNKELLFSTNFMMGSENKTDQETRWINSDEPAKLRAGLDRSQEYWILEVDYNSFFVAYRCNEHKYTSHKLASIYTRMRNPLNSLIHKVLEFAAQKSTINRIWFSRINQTNCP